MRFPIFLPESYFTNLLIGQAHEKVFHQRVNPTLVQLRSNYWPPSARRCIQAVLQKCRLCRIFDSQAFKLAAPPALPTFRMDTSQAFANVGVDHMGPVWVKDIYEKGSLHKAYIALYTCASSRMVHLELQPSLKATDLVKSLKRTLGRIGIPKLMISDNHKCFKSNLVQQFAAKRSMNWRFILQRAPHWGGFYETLNRLIKKALFKSIKGARLTFEELETVLIEIECILNCRPLTYVYDDCNFVPLTPSHLAYGRRLLDTDTSLTFSTDASKRCKQISATINRFWRRFESEYLTQLRQRSFNKEAHFPSVGSVVLLQDKFHPRIEWKRGVVTELIRSSADGVPRGAVLRLSNGETLNRPLNLLCPTEIEQSDDSPREISSDFPTLDAVSPVDISSDTQIALPDNPQNLNDDLVRPDTDVLSVRPRRLAAATGNLRRQLAQT